MNLCNCHTHITKNKDWEIFSTEQGLESMKFHSLGVHPWNSGKTNLEQSLKTIRTAINSKTLAIGEIGLDKTKGPDFQIQQTIFQAQILLAEEEKLPVLLHCVKSWNEIASFKRKIKPIQPWIYHGFNKSNLIESVLKENIIISIGPAILTNKKLQNGILSIPNEMLLMETDNSEIPIELVYEQVAQLKGITLVLLREIIEQNFKRIFQKWHIG